MKGRKSQVKMLSVLLTAAVLGVLVSAHWSMGATRSTVSADQVERTVRRLELEQEELKETVGRLREELHEQQGQVTANTGMLQELSSELAAQKMRAGLVSVRGPGVQVILDDSPRNPTGKADDLLIHDYDLRDVISVLWLAGAEAVSIGDERIVSTTSIYCVGSTVLVNDTRLSPPYRISAIGDPALLLDYLGNPGYLRELELRSDRFGLRVEYVQTEMITLPAYRGSLQRRFVQPGS